MTASNQTSKVDRCMMIVFFFFTLYPSVVTDWRSQIYAN